MKYNIKPHQSLDSCWRKHSIKPHQSLYGCWRKEELYEL